MQFNEIVNFQIIMQNIPVGEDVKKDIKKRLRLNVKAFLKANISFKYKITYPILAYLDQDSLNNVNGGEKCYL